MEQLISALKKPGNKKKGGNVKFSNDNSILIIPNRYEKYSELENCNLMSINFIFILIVFIIIMFVSKNIYHLYKKKYTNIQKK